LIKCSRKFYRVGPDHTPRPGQKFVTQTLTPDLFALANFRVFVVSGPQKQI